MTTFSAHLSSTLAAVGMLEREEKRMSAWADCLVDCLRSDGRLLVAGNGGSAAQAQHLTAELVGRYQQERPALAAIALHAETSSLTALINDYGIEEMFARQVRAHGRKPDILLLLSTSGRSRNLISAANAGRSAGLRVWGLLGPAPNPLGALCHDSVCVSAPTAAAVQEAHLVALHCLCELLDERLIVGSPPPLAGSTGVGALRT